MTGIILIFGKYLLTISFVCQISINLIGIDKADVKILRKILLATYRKRS